MTTAIETPTKLPAVGLHKGLPYSEYDRWDALRHSILVKFNRTAAHAREALVNPADPSEAQECGTAAHLAVLEPNRFALECVAAPKFDKRTTEGKKGWSDFQAENAGKTVLTQDEHTLCLRMRDSIWAHPTARELLMGTGVNEAAALWVDEDTGVTCKARLDRLTSLASWPVIVDLKTTRNAGRRSFERDIYSHYYFQQAAMYLDGCNALAPLPRKFMFIAVEKEPPYCVAIYELDDDAIKLGLDDYQRHLAAYAECISTGVWKGYGDGADLISVPSWAFRAFPEGE